MYTGTSEIISIIVLLGILLRNALPFEKPYSTSLRILARQPLFQFLAWMLVLLAMDWDINVGALAFLVVFLWIADVHLLSSDLFLG